MNSFIIVITILLCIASGCLAQPELLLRERAPKRIVLEHPESHKRAGLPVIRIGTTHIDFGPEVGWGELLKHVWQLYFAKNLTYAIGGVAYRLQVTSYLDDESDGNTTVALVNTLVNVDKVHLLITGYEGDTANAFIPAAEAAGIPTLCAGAFELSFYPPGYLYWTVNTLPNINILGYECALPLVQAGATNFTVVTPNSTWASLGGAGFEELVVNALIMGGLNFTPPYLNVSDDAWTNPALLDPIIQAMAAANPDVAVFEFGQYNNIIFIDRMRRNNYNPKAYFAWGTGSYPQIRLNLTWEDAGSLISEAYEADLNASDPLWGTSLRYDAELLQNFGIPSSNADANLASALTILDYALSVTKDLTPANLRAAILSFNGSTIVGNLSFTNNTVNRQLYCFQNDFPNATGILTVWPPESPQYTKLIYPAPISYPPHYFDQFHPKASDTEQNILIGVFAVFGGLIIIGLLVFIFIKTKYHAIFIPKDEKNEEWGA